VITAPPPDFGPVAQQASTESVAIVLTQLYMRARVQSQMEQTLPATATQQQLAIPEGQPGHIPKGGIRLNSVNLEQRGQDASRVNLIAIGMSPWLRSDTAEASDPSGNTRRLTQSVIPRNFILRLRLIPHLITADTEMSLAKRQTLLGCAAPDTTCAGILLSLGFFELYDQGFGEQVVCNGGRGGVPQRSPNYDFVAAQVLQGALDTVNGRVIPASAPGGQPTVIPPLPPITIPTTGILSMVSGLAGGTAVKLVGVAVGTDPDLKIALLLDRGSPVPFSPEPDFRTPNTDWGVKIDASFLTSFVASEVTTRASSNAPPVTIPSGGVAVALLPGRIDITASGIATTAVLSCSVPVSLSLSITPGVCRNASGESVLRMCPGPVQSAVSGTVCAFFDFIIGGTANATVSTCPGCPPGPPQDPCNPMRVQFDAGPNDRLYATSVDTSGIFAVSGRSTFMDARLAAAGTPRAVAPNACP
jgi:hypothetical protein